jgi:hypothetical protein
MLHSTFCIRCDKLQDVIVCVILIRKYYINKCPVIDRHVGTSIVMYVLAVTENFTILVDMFPNTTQIKEIYVS